MKTQAFFAQQIEFIKQCIRLGQDNKTVRSNYMQQWPETTTGMWEKRFAKANQQVKDEQKLVTELANARIEQEVAARVGHILTVAERKAILTQIAQGNCRVNKPKNIGGKFEYVECEPDFDDRIKAIAELNKIDGSYQPIRADITTNGQSLTPVTTTVIQFNGVDVPLLQ